MTSRTRLAGGVALAVLLALLFPSRSNKTVVLAATESPETVVVMKRISNVTPTTAVVAQEAHRTPQRASRSGSRSRPVQTVTASHSGSHRGYGSAKECAAMVEHGGSYDRSSNPGHFGRYQFSRGTWAAYGGNPNTWGHASPEEQDAVFERAWATPGGSRNWVSYDGC